MPCTLKLVTAFFLLFGILASQTTADVSTIVATGKIADSTYSNEWLKLTVEAPQARFIQAPVVDVKGRRARLVQVHHEPAAKEQRFNLAVLVDALANYPTLTDSAHYVRSVRHQLEKQGLRTVSEEFPTKIGGRDFWGVILLSRDPRYHRGIYAAFDRGFIVSFDVETSEMGGLQRILAANIRFSQVSRKQ